MSKWKQKYYIAPKNLARKVKARNCLRCSDEFQSLNFGQRMCKACRAFISNGKGIPRGRFFFGKVMVEGD